MRMETRKSIRLKGYDYGQNGAYFITICTDNRKKIFWSGVPYDRCGDRGIKIHYHQKDQ